MIDRFDIRYPWEESIHKDAYQSHSLKRVVSFSPASSVCQLEVLERGHGCFLISHASWHAGSWCGSTFQTPWRLAVKQWDTKKPDVVLKLRGSQHGLQVWTLNHSYGTHFSVCEFHVTVHQSDFKQIIMSMDFWHLLPDGCEDRTHIHRICCSFLLQRNNCQIPFEVSGV